MSAVLLTACPPAAAPPGGGSPCDPGFDLVDGACLAACPAGHQHLAGGCAPATPSSPCDAGTMPVVGFTECQPVGWTSCDAGFERDPSGWGCAPVLPAAPCTGATRAALGHRECVPVGDCAAPFPPPGATRFVDPSRPENLSHFHTISRALLNAPAGAVIAIEAGTYPEEIDLVTPVTLVGRCAQQVTITPPGPGRPGLLVLGVDAGVSGLSFTGHDPGVEVNSGGHLALSRARLEGNTQFGALVAGAGSELRLDEVVVRGTLSEGNDFGTGVQVQDGASSIARAVEVSGNHSAGVAVLDLGPVPVPAQLTLEDAVIDGTHVTPSGLNGMGLLVIGGATADVRTAAILGSDRIGALATGPGSRLTLSDVVLSGAGTPPAPATGQSCGLGAQDGALLEVHRATLSRNFGGGVVLLTSGPATLEAVSVVDTQESNLVRGSGVTVAYGSTAALRSVAMVRSHSVGLDVGTQGSSATAERALVEDTVPSLIDGIARSASVENGTLSASESTFRGAGEVAIFAGGADVGVTLTSTLVADVNGSSVTSSSYGHGLLTRYGAHATVSDSVIRACVGAGMIVDDASAILSGSLVASNAVGVHAQDGSTVATGQADAGARVFVVTDDTLFVGNATRIGLGTVPVPSASAR